VLADDVDLGEMKCSPPKRRTVSDWRESITASCAKTRIASGSRIGFTIEPGILIL
jgi:hypothetical protein